MDLASQSIVNCSSLGLLGNAGTEELRSQDNVTDKHVDLRI